MQVRVKLSTLLRQCTNWQEFVELNGNTPMACLQDLEAKYPDIRKWIYDKHGKMWDRLQFFVNGEMICPDELTHPIKEGDELFFLLNIGGG